MGQGGLRSGTCSGSNDELRLLPQLVASVCQRSLAAVAAGRRPANLHGGPDRLSTMRFLRIAFALALPASIALAQNVPAARLTLTSNTPILTSDVVNTSTVYYTPYEGAYVPAPNGLSGGISGVFGPSQLTLTLTSTHNTAGNIYDVFYGQSGAQVLCTGPAWASPTSRGTGSGTTEIRQVQGLWVNAVNLTNCYNGASNYTTFTAGWALYVGSVYMTGDGTTSVVMKPAAAAGGSANVIGLSNAYRRVPIYSLARDSNTSWSYSTNTWRPTDNSSSNRVTWLDGLAQTAVTASCSVQAATATTNQGIAIGVSLDSTTAAPVISGQMYPTAGATFFLKSPEENFAPQLGLHYLQAMEVAPTSVTATFYGAGVVQTLTFRGEY